MPDQTSIDLIKYDGLSLEKKRKCNKLLDSFEQITGARPDYIIFAPGRVNLIGEHIDYHGFPVLPMAIQQGHWLACNLSTGLTNDCTNRNSIYLFNVHQEMYSSWSGAHSFVYGAELAKSHEWRNYFLCGYHGVLAKNLLEIEPRDILNHASQIASDLDRLIASDSLLTKLGNLKVLVDSDLPAASGLSSSSALVCSAAIATTLLLHNSSPNSGNRAIIDRCALADWCARFEQLIGTMGGGMDQAVIMMGQENFAKFIEFVPNLKTHNVHLPVDVVWLVSHSGVNCAKADSNGFNSRVLETKIGAAMIAKASGHTSIKLDSTITLQQVKETCFKSESIQEIVSHIRNKVFFNTNSWSVDDICKNLEIGRSQLIENFRTSDKFLREQNDKLSLLNRCEHVFEESQRVEQFRSICLTTNDPVMMGHLMTQSHYSLRDKYDCSHPALDRLVSVALEAGALGSRLTGAGWGGCTISLVEESKCDTVQDILKQISGFTFRTKPQSGSQIIKF